MGIMSEIHHVTSNLLNINFLWWFLIWPWIFSIFIPKWPNLEHQKECFLFQNWEFVDIGCHGNNSIVRFSHMRSNSQKAFYKVSMTENGMEIFILNQKLWRFLSTWWKHSIFAYLCKLDANISIYAQYSIFDIFLVPRIPHFIRAYLRNRLEYFDKLYIILKHVSKPKIINSPSEDHFPLIQHICYAIHNVSDV